LVPGGQGRRLETDPKQPQLLSPAGGSGAFSFSAELLILAACITAHNLGFPRLPSIQALELTLDEQRSALSSSASLLGTFRASFRQADFLQSLRTSKSWGSTWFSSKKAIWPRVTI